MPAKNDSITSHWLLSRELHDDSGLCQMATAAPPGLKRSAPALVRLHGGIEKEVIRIVAICEGDWPVVPKPSDVLPNRTYLRGSRKLTGPVSLSGKRSAYSVELTLEYAVNISEGLDGPAPLGSLPWRNKPYTTPVNEVMPAEYFKSGLISSQYQQPQKIWLPTPEPAPPFVPLPIAQEPQSNLPGYGF